MKYLTLIILIFLVKFISSSQEKCGIILDKKVKHQYRTQQSITQTAQ